MMQLKYILSLFLLSNALALLTKYGSENILTDYVIFESKDFKDDEEMHFKIQTIRDNFNDLYDYAEYQYCADRNCISHSSSHYSYYKKTSFESDNSYNYETKYFTIKKQKSQYNNIGGNYMKIYFFFEHSYWGVVTNTKEDEGKIETWVIIVIVVVVVAIIAGIIIFCVCRRIRNKRAMAAANARQVAVVEAQNQAYAAQNAAYAAQNAYIAEQNYQAQAYQNQVYQDPNLMAPGAAPYTGYTSKAVL